MESVETLLSMTFLRFMIFLKRRKILLWPDSIQNPLRNLSTSTGKNLFQVKRNQAGICTSPPHLDQEDSSNQLKVIKNFKNLRQKIGEDFNFRVYGAGYFIKIITQDAKHWYSYNSKLSPKQFLISKGVIVE